MRHTKELQFGESRIVVKELTLAEIRAWLGDTEEQGEPDLVGGLLYEDCHLAELLKFSDATPEQLEAMTQSELAQLRDTAKALNRDFFGLRQRLFDLAGKLPHSATSSATSAP